MKSSKGREAKDFEVWTTQGAAGDDNLRADRAITTYAVLVRIRTSAKILYFHLLIGPVGLFGVLPVGWVSGQGWLFKWINVAAELVVTENIAPHSSCGSVILYARYSNVVTTISNAQTIFDIDSGGTCIASTIFCGCGWPDRRLRQAIRMRSQANYAHPLSALFTYHK